MCLTLYWTLALVHVSRLTPWMNPGLLACQSAAWRRNEHCLSCMSVSCLTPYWSLALLYVSQLPDPVLNTGTLACQSAALHRTEHWVPCMPVSCLTPYWTLAPLYVSQLPDSVNQPRLPCMSVSCLILCIDARPPACKTVVRSCDNPGSLACQSVAWPCEWTLAILHISHSTSQTILGEMRTNTKRHASTEREKQT
jgi:hypothetical protein